MALCKSPIPVKNMAGTAPCRQCQLCRQNKRRQKTTRMALEARNWNDSLFVTLTYDDEHLPTQYMDPNTGQYFFHDGGVLCPPDLRLFINKIRVKLPPKSFRYFACGEYGDETFRPHYHLVFFGFSKAKHESLIRESWSEPYSKIPFCSPDRLDVQVPKSDWDVAQYCCSYIMKRMTNASDPRLENRTPEFFRSSKGIGLSFVDDYVRALQTQSGNAYTARMEDIPRSILLNGKNLPLDRYMQEKILNALDPDQKIKKARLTKFEKSMSSLRTRASIRKKIDPGQVSLSDLANQLQLETAQAVKNVETKADIFTRRKKTDV